MIYLLAQFPLQLVVFPGERIPLHIFEPRYRELIADCQQLVMPFGITPMIDGTVQEVGTSLRLDSVKKRYPDGRMDISVYATHCYKIHRYPVTTEGKTYGSAMVEDLHPVDMPDQALTRQMQKLMEELYAMMRIPLKKIPDHFELHQIAHKIGFTLAEEYHLLSMNDIKTQQQYVIERLEMIVPQVREMEEIRKRIEMNGDTRYIIPPN